MAFTFATFKSDSVKKTFEVDNCGIAFLGGAFNSNHAGVTLLNAGQFVFNIFVRNFNDGTYCLNTFVCTKSDLGINRCFKGKSQALVLANLGILDSRSTDSVQFFLLYAHLKG